MCNFDLYSKDILFNRFAELLVHVLYKHKR